MLLREKFPSLEKYGCHLKFYQKSFPPHGCQGLGNQFPSFNILNEFLHLRITRLSPLLELGPMLLQPLLVIPSFGNHDTLLPSSQDLALNKDTPKLFLLTATRHVIVHTNCVFPCLPNLVAQNGILLLRARVVVTYEARYAVGGALLATYIGDELIR